MFSPAVLAHFITVGFSRRLPAANVGINTSDSIAGSVYVPYAARLPLTAYLHGLLRRVHIMNRFWRMCRESGQVLMYNETHTRIEADDRMIR